MFSNSVKIPWFFIIALTCLSATTSTMAAQQRARKPFKLADEIGLTLFEDFEENVRFSPDGNYFVVKTHCGRLDLNRTEDSLRFYSSKDAEKFLKSPEGALPPPPVWEVRRSAEKGSPISHWRWLADSSGVAFLQSTAYDSQRILLADLRRKTVEPLTSAKEAVDQFDVRDRNHYVYTAGDWTERKKKINAEHQAPAVVGTGRRLAELLFPDDPTFASLGSSSYLWAVTGGQRFQVKNNGTSIVPRGGLTLSPDGQSLVTELVVPDVPSSWERLYPPPYASSAYRIRAGHQDVGSGSVHQYVRIDLQTGSVQSLTEAPESNGAGEWAIVYPGGPSWSKDGRAILLPGTFLKSNENAPSRPCIAVVDLAFKTRTCVEVLNGHTETGVEEGYHSFKEIRFVDGDKQRAILTFRNREFGVEGTTEYRRAADGTWEVAGSTIGDPGAEPRGLKITTKESFTEPPQLVASKKETSRILWDLNPQLKNFELGEASVYNWKDKEGRDWKGGLYKPSKYMLSRRYPLVIQTHGFLAGFRPSGVYPTAFAARALAAAGIMVLQVGENCPNVTAQEGPCAVSGYESGANQLVSEGLVDPEKIGIIGFSRSCFYVMQTLAFGSIHLKAASITDGVMEDYFQYLQEAGAGDRVALEANSMIGAAPFGEGLQLWLKRSPGFNLDKVTAPLLVVGEGPRSLLFNWGPYAGLHYLHKPVDLIMLNTGEHVLTNPAVRMASQGGSVDWFRFWLKDEEDPDPTKAGQYARWRELRKLQEENKHKPTVPQAASN